MGLLPVFFALAVGYAAGKAKLIDNKHVPGFNTLTMTIALPIALFGILAGSKRDDVIEHWAVAAVGLLVMGVTFVGVYLLQRRGWGMTAPSSAVQALTVGFPNAAAVGIPIADAVLGGTGQLAVAVTLAVGGITLSPATIVILDRGAQGARGSLAGAVFRAIRTPVVIAPILGIVWSLSGLPYPPLLDSTLSELGSITAGLALFLTGLVLSAQRVTPSANVAISTAISVVVRPALAILAVKAFQLPSVMAAEVVLLMAIPSGFFGVLLALNRGQPSPLAGATLFYSTIVSIGTLSLVILLLPAL